MQEQRKNKEKKRENHALKGTSACVLELNGLSLWYRIINFVEL